MSDEGVLARDKALRARLGVPARTRERAHVADRRILSRQCCAHDRAYVRGTYWACVRQRQACSETMLCARARQGVGRALVRALLSPVATELSSSLVHCVVHCLSHCSLTLFMCIVHRYFTHGVSKSGFESNGTRNIWKKKKFDPQELVCHI